VKEPRRTVRLISDSARRGLFVMIVGNLIKLDERFVSGGGLSRHYESNEGALDAVFAAGGS
jgi:hypothetical protein